MNQNRYLNIDATLEKISSEFKVSPELRYLSASAFFAILKPVNKKFRRFFPCRDFGTTFSKKVVKEKYFMKKHLETGTKAEKRDLKNRPRMKIHGASLRKPSKFAGLKLIKSKR